MNSDEDERSSSYQNSDTSLQGTPRHHNTDDEDDEDDPSDSDSDDDGRSASETMEA